MSLKKPLLQMSCWRHFQSAQYLVRVLEKKESVYKNVTRKKSFTLSLDEPSLSLEQNTEIANLKQLIASASAELDSVVQRLDHQLSAAEIHRDVVLALVDMQRKVQVRIQELSSTLEMLYEREVQDFLNTSKAVKHFVQTPKQSSMMKLEHSLVFLIYWP